MFGIKKSHSLVQRHLLDEYDDVDKRVALLSASGRRARGEDLDSIARDLRQVRLALVDLDYVETGDVPEWTDAELDLMGWLPALVLADRWDEVTAIERRGYSNAMARFAARHYDDFPYRDEDDLPDEGRVVDEDGNLLVSSPETSVDDVAPGNPVTDDPNVETITLPDGLDTSDPDVRRKVMKVVREQYGQAYVAMWPRHTDWPDGVPFTLPVVDVRPGATDLSLSADAKPNGALEFAQRVEDNALGYLVAWDPYARRAVAARLDDETLSVRNRLAARLGVPPHEVEVALHHVYDPKIGERRLDQIVVTRAAWGKKTAQDKQVFLGQFVTELPHGSSGWLVEEDASTGWSRLVYGPPRKLPGTVPMSTLLPDRIKPDQWHLLPLGVTDGLQVTGIDLTLGPHSLIVGPTGSGKTVALVQLIVSALSRGHEVHMVDPTKGGLDFLSVKAWCTGWAESLPQAQALIEKIYAEVTRRKAILQEYGAVKWSDLPDAVQTAKGIKPTLVVIDEYGSLVIEESIPKALPKEHPFRAEADERNVARAIIAGTVGRLAREARFAGVHLAIALQRPDAGIVGGEMRSNLTSSVQLAPPGKPVSREALAMVFPGDVGPQAAVTLAELDDGTSRGLAVMAADGGSVEGFRVGYAKPGEVPGILRSLGAPEATPWVVGEPTTAVKPEPDFEIIEGSQTQPVPATTDVVELDAFEFTLDDDETDDEPVETTPVAAVDDDPFADLFSEEPKATPVAPGVDEDNPFAEPTVRPVVDDEDNPFT